MFKYRDYYSDPLYRSMARLIGLNNIDKLTMELNRQYETYGIIRLNRVFDWINKNNFKFKIIKVGIFRKKYKTVKNENFNIDTT